MPVRSKLSGEKEMARRLRNVANRFPRVVERAMYRKGEEIMKVSKREYVPVEDGILRGSGMVHKPEHKGNTFSVELSYGGAAADYAVAVHEHLSEHSPPTWRGTRVQFSPRGHGPKYLERPLMKAVKTIARDIAKMLNIDGLVKTS